MKYLKINNKIYNCFEVDLEKEIAKLNKFKEQIEARILELSTIKNN